MDPFIPTIDVGPLDTASVQIGRELAGACHEVGFCYLSGHGIPARIETDAVAATRAFFELDTQAKSRLSIANSPHFRGYTPFGAELTRGQRDWREQLDLGRDESAEPVAAGDPAWRRLRGPNQWPAELPELRRAVNTWTAQMERLSVGVLRALAVGLGQQANCFDAYMLPRGDLHLKLLRYRGESPRGDAQEANAPEASYASEQGVGWHNDSGVLTFVLQDSTGGLEVRTDSGVVAAKPRPGTYLMNIGEMLQRATAGFLRATQHRVIGPPPGRERISLAYFAHPKYESNFAAMTLPAELADRIRDNVAADPANPIHACFGDNYLKIRLRSHPDVAERFYRDTARPIRIGHTTA